MVLQTPGGDLVEILRQEDPEVWEIFGGKKLSQDQILEKLSEMKDLTGTSALTFLTRGDMTSVAVVVKRHCIPE